MRFTQWTRAYRFTQEYRLVSRAQGAVAAEGGGVLVAFDYAANRKVPLPDAVRAAIRALEGSIPMRTGAEE